MSDSDSSNNVSPDADNEDCRPPTLRVGFDTKKDAIDAVKLAAVLAGKSLMLDNKKSGGKTVVLGCTDRLAKHATGSCPVHCRVNRLKDGKWHVSQKGFVFAHLNCNTKQKISSRLLAKNKSVQIAVESDNTISGKALQGQVSGHLNISTNRRMMYRVKDVLKEATQADVLRNYYLMEPWAAKFEELNPNSECSIEWSEDGVFQRLFIMHAANMQVLLHSTQSLAKEDCAFMKSPTYNGQFMALSIVDGNLNNVLLAAALVPAEDKANYEWFFGKLNANDEVRDILGDVKFTHISDRDKGLAPALDSSFPSANKMNCFHHIVGNIKASKTIPSLGGRVGELWAAQSAKTAVEFEGCLASLNGYRPQVVECLRTIHGGDDSWALYKQI